MNALGALGVTPLIVGGMCVALEGHSLFALFFGDCKKKVPRKATKHWNDSLKNKQNSAK